MDTPAALVNMPFGAIQSPSIQLGLLKAACKKQNINIDDHYFNLAFAKVIGGRIYNALSYIRGPLVGEWLFAHTAFPELQSGQNFIEEYREFVDVVCSAASCSISTILKIRDRIVPRFVEMAAQTLSGYEVVGFSSTFQQNVPSLSVARRLKEISPGTRIVFGGANFEGPMGAEYMKAFDFIDVVVSGEADDLIANLFSELSAGRMPEPQYGVFVRGKEENIRKDERRSFSGSMDDLPEPDYDQYFQTFTELQFSIDDIQFPQFLPFESSRGCWWGQKHHCTFCGLNGGSMAYRGKTPVRSVQELKSLAQRYNIRNISAVDNIIYKNGLLEYCRLLEEQSPKFDLFYEVKANLSREEIEALSRAGIKRVQTGIESLSDDVLRLMRKGTNALLNLNVLRWMLKEGINASWNFLYGFPGESEVDYVYQLHLFRRLHHIPPPHGISQIRLDRFSPNFNLAELRDNFDSVKPFSWYHYLYPSNVNLDEAAYFFEGSVKNGAPFGIIEDIIDEIKIWKLKWYQTDFAHPFERGGSDVPTLTVIWNTDGAEILDGRDKPTAPIRIALPAKTALVYRMAFERPTSVEQLADKTGIEVSGISEILTFLDEAKLIARNGNLVLSLALPKNLFTDQENTENHICYASTARA